MQTRKFLSVAPGSAATTDAAAPLAPPDPKHAARSVSGGVLRYSIDVRAVLIVAVATVLSILPFVREMPWWQLAVIWVAVVYLRTFCAFIQHNHNHLSVFRPWLLNRIFDLVLAQHTGYASALWQLHHNLGHHRDYLDPGHDVASLLEPQSGLPRPRWRYAVRGNLTIHRDAIRIARASQLQRGRKLVYKLGFEVAAQCLIAVALLLVQPWLALAFFVLPNIINGFLIWWESYPHHLEMPGTSVYDSSMTVADPGYNLMTFNIGHHTAHHQKPTLHWSLLPEQTARIRHLIHRDCMKREFSTLGARAVRWIAARRTACEHEREGASS
jgi:fatty acid desaturase